MALTVRQAAIVARSILWYDPGTKEEHALQARMVNRNENGVSLRRILDSSAYAELVRRRGGNPGSYFPAYRVGEFR